MSKRTTGQDERLTGFKCQTLQLPGSRVGCGGRQVNSETNNLAYVCPLRLPWLNVRGLVVWRQWFHFSENYLVFGNIVTVRKVTLSLRTWYYCSWIDAIYSYEWEDVGLWEDYHLIYNTMTLRSSWKISTRFLSLVMTQCCPASSQDPLLMPVLHVMNGTIASSPRQCLHFSILSAGGNGGIGNERSNNRCNVLH